MVIEQTRVEVNRLRRRYQPEELEFCTTSADVPPLKDFIGQERAVKSMQFGLNMKAPGYNIFVSGPPGTGKTTYIQTVVTQVAAREEVPGDWCLLYNFNNPDMPLAVTLPAGMGQKFQRDMSNLIEELKTGLAKLFEGKDYENRKNTILRGLQQQLEDALNQLKQEANESGFIMKTSEEGIFFIPVQDGKPLSSEQYQALPEETRVSFEQKLKQLQKRTEEIVYDGRMMEKQAEHVVAQMDQELVRETTSPLFKKLEHRYRDFPRIITHLRHLAEDLISKVSAGHQESAAEDESHDFYKNYLVNLLVNNADTFGAPVVVETNPHYYNLFGKLEYRSQMGTVNTDFTMIKPGAVHRANGGYLILQAKDLFADPHSWDALKKALKNRQVTVENIGETQRSVPTISIKPEPIPLNVKVILIGSPRFYHLLQQVDEDFAKLFKVMVDFEVVMPRTSENLRNYVAFVGSVCRREGLPHFDRSGLAEIIEYGSRLAANQNKLSTQFNEVVEIILESAAWAQSAGAQLVSAVHVRQAIKEKIYRCSRVEERIQELILRGKILVDTTGAVVGQVNGLAVLDTGYYAFGKPSRITAKTFMGHEGLVNIETETRMGGSIHAKGVHTLTGYLGSMFAQDKPLCLSARLTFEQLYEGVEGDSASSAELYALLSSLAGVPVKQSLAVTGSVNQNGEIQPIGGVTEKVEGFFGVCQARGLTGNQGVIIPVQNVDNLMLSHEVVAAVEQGLFHIYAISRIEEGIELLTGMPAGERGPDGRYTPGSVLAMVDAKLQQYAEGLQRFHG
ncbi:peptidase S16, lon domain-containing protein [Desulfotomaculum nigrificans CO-1-SRB]|uniref:endopeptidase La n=1 Tax=Desulfotomaculum nigrificans (strain DSM 14880 / VKM B-2319 / CO-1-SRB) TaxID=868595 RepID=F6B9F2_DESCC|nr:ATP-binding protein [Desulfotomaculum nigrificans]AEF93728.1 peptidase S16, lon domain-containing protein [Desulfotomaculum nigrificans CO-1-SRB]